MKRYEQMEQRRFEQQVAPNIDQAAPAPVRGPVRIQPPNTKLPDLSMIQTALSDGAKLAVQLAGYAKKAQDEADELAQIDFDGWVKSETIRRSAEFAKLPIREQEAQSAAFRDRFVADAKAYAANLDFSSRRRQVVDRMIPAHADQFGSRLYAESIRQMERNNCDKIVNNLKSSIDAADVVAAGTWQDRADAKGINTGMTRDQAVSRAASNKLNGQLPQLSSGEIARQIRATDEFLAENRPVYDLGDGVKLTRKDLQRFRDNADRMLFHKKTEETDAFLASVVDGTNELTPEDLKQMHDNGTLSDRQYKLWTDVLKSERKKERGAAASSKAKESSGKDKINAFKLHVADTQWSSDPTVNVEQREKLLGQTEKLFADDPDALLKLREHVEKAAREGVAGKGVFNTGEGKIVFDFIKDQYRNNNGKYQGLKWDPWGWEKDDSQTFMASRYYEIMDYARERIAAGDNAQKVIADIKERVERLNDGKIRQVLDRRSRYSVPEWSGEIAIGPSSRPDGDVGNYNGKKVISRGGKWYYAE